MTANLNNTVIKVLNAEHGKKVIKWWKDQGVDTFNFNGNSIGSYYGLVNNKFNKFIFCPPHGSEVIELPDDNFTLPQYWHVIVTVVNHDMLLKWFNGLHLPIGNICGMCKSINSDNTITYTKEHNPRTSIKSPNYDFGIEITTEQFKKYVMNENKKISGYKLKDKYKNNKSVCGAACDIEGYNCFGMTTITSRTAIICTSEYPYNDSIQKLKEAGVFELWFEPVYEQVKTLPVINGYNGKIINNSVVEYGCVTFNVDALKTILTCSKNLGSRTITAITLSSGVVITLAEIEQIVDYMMITTANVRS